MKIKTQDLTGAALDWAIVRANFEINFETVWSQGGCEYSTDWAQGGPIIEREGINLDNYEKNPRWSAWTPAPDRESGESQAYGPTPLIAAMRCFVQSRLGDEVDVPDDLV